MAKASVSQGCTTALQLEKKNVWVILAPSLRLECSSKIIAHCSLRLLGSRDLSASAPQVVETTGTSHHTYPGLKLLSSSDPPALASHSAGMIGVSHHAWPGQKYLISKNKWLKLQMSSIH